MNRYNHFFCGTFAFAILILIFPIVVKADRFGDPIALSKADKVTLTAQASGFASRGSSINVPPGASFTLTWTMPATWKGCWSNWQSDMITGSGSKTGGLVSGENKRTFVITCAGVGQAQTASVTVNVVKPDLSVVSFTGVATRATYKRAVKGHALIRAVTDNTGTVIKPAVPAVADDPGIPKNAYYEGPITFRAVVRNSGMTSVPATPPVITSYQLAQTRTPTKADTVWTEMNAANLERGNTAIDPGAAPNVATYVHPAGVSGSVPFYFMAKVDSTEKVNESNEKNNTKIIGPYIFVAKPTTTP